MKLSVVILNYNVHYFLEQTIVSVKRAVRNIDSEIIVIDNNSSDASCEMVKQRFPEIALIENKENVGFSKANNQAVKVAKGDYVCILNPDTAVAEDTFIKCFVHLETLENVGALGVYLMDGTGNFLPESKRNVPTRRASLLKLFGATNRYYATAISCEESGGISVLVGAFMLLKRSVYNEVGGFDEDYFMYGEDIDLSYKLLKAGYQNYYLGSSEVLHYKGESTQKGAAYFNRFYGAMQIFYKKHFKANLLLDILVQVGVVMVKKMRVTSATKKIKTQHTPKIAYLFTENLSLLKRLSETIEIPIKSSSKLILQDEPLNNAMFIFDVDYMSYSQIFMVMKKFKNQNNQFRICPSGCNFMLGSDQSDEKGSVVVF